MSAWLFAKCVADAEALLRLGMTTIYLEDKTEDLPWAIATEVSHGGLVRGGIPISYWVTGKHSCGLEFRWSIEIEDRSADGSPESKINVEHCRHVLLGLLPAAASKQFADLLQKAADEVDGRQLQFQKAADRQGAIARSLRDVIAASKERP